MNKLSFVLVAAALLAAAGCKKKQEGDACARALDHSMALAKAELSEMPGVDEKGLQKVHDISLQRCREDHWHEDMLDCLNKAKQDVDSEECYGLYMGFDQKNKLRQAGVHPLRPAEGAAELGSAGGTTGSDTGSAGSAGSAAAPK